MWITSGVLPNRKEEEAEVVVACPGASPHCGAKPWPTSMFPSLEIAFGDAPPKSANRECCLR